MSEANGDSMEVDEQQQQQQQAGSAPAQAHSAARAVFTVEPARPSAAAQARAATAAPASTAAANDAAAAAAAAAVPAVLQSPVLPLAARLPQRRRQSPTPLMRMVPSAASWRRGVADAAASAAGSANGGYSSGDTSSSALQRRGSATAAAADADADEEVYAALREAKEIRVGERYQAANIPECRSRGKFIVSHMLRFLVYVLAYTALVPDVGAVPGCARLL
jgi:hypothetical protein